MKESTNALRERMAWAIARGDADALLVCLRSGADPNWRIGGEALKQLVWGGGEPVRSALHWILARGDAALARILIEAGAKIRADDLLTDGLFDHWSDDLAALLVEGGGGSVRQYGPRPIYSASSSRQIQQSVRGGLPAATGR